MDQDWQRHSSQKFFINSLFEPIFWRTATNYLAETRSVIVCTLNMWLVGWLTSNTQQSTKQRHGLARHLQEQVSVAAILPIMTLVRKMIILHQSLQLVLEYTNRCPISEGSYTYWMAKESEEKVEIRNVLTNNAVVKLLTLGHYWPADTIFIQTTLLHQSSSPNSCIAWALHWLDRKKYEDLPELRAKTGKKACMLDSS